MSKKETRSLTNTTPDLYSTIHDELLGLGHEIHERSEVKEYEILLLSEITEFLENFIKNPAKETLHQKMEYYIHTYGYVQVLSAFQVCVGQISQNEYQEIQTVFSSIQKDFRDFYNQTLISQPGTSIGMTLCFFFKKYTQYEYNSTRQARTFIGLVSIPHKLDCDLYTMLAADLARQYGFQSQFVRYTNHVNSIIGGTHYERTAFSPLDRQQFTLREKQRQDDVSMFLATVKGIQLSANPTGIHQQYYMQIQVLRALLSGERDKDDLENTRIGIGNLYGDLIPVDLFTQEIGYRQSLLLSVIHNNLSVLEDYILHLPKSNIRAELIGKLEKTKQRLQSYYGNRLVASRNDVSSLILLNYLSSHKSDVVDKLNISRIPSIESFAFDIRIYEGANGKKITESLSTMLQNTYNQLSIGDLVKSLASYEVFLDSLDKEVTNKILTAVSLEEIRGNMQTIEEAFGKEKLSQPEITETLFIRKELCKNEVGYFDWNFSDIGNTEIVIGRNTKIQLPNQTIDYLLEANASPEELLCNPFSDRIFQLLGYTGKSFSETIQSISYDEIGFLAFAYSVRYFETHLGNLFTNEEERMLRNPAVLLSEKPTKISDHHIDIGTTAFWESRLGKICEQPIYFEIFNALCVAAGKKVSTQKEGEGPETLYHALAGVSPNRDAIYHSAGIAGFWGEMRMDIAHMDYKGFGEGIIAYTTNQDKSMNTILFKEVKTQDPIDLVSLLLCYGIDNRLPTEPPDTILIYAGKEQIKLTYDPFMQKIAPKDTTLPLGISFKSNRLHIDHQYLAMYTPLMISVRTETIRDQRQLHCISNYPVHTEVPQTTFILSPTLFESGTSVLSEEQKKELDSILPKLLFWLRQKNTSIVVEGHTDNVGSEQFNQKLSEERAMGVKNYLLALLSPYLPGMNLDTRITSRGFGSEQPIGSNQTPDGRKKNRRVILRALPSQE